MTTDTEAGSTRDLATVLAAASSRIDQWSQLNALARAWATAGSGNARATKLRGDSASQFAALSRIEHCWAYPGRRLLAEPASELAPLFSARLDRAQFNIGAGQHPGGVLG